MVTLECNDVSFSWNATSGPDIPALANITFEASDGQIVGIIGPSGCGKSTLVQILSGLEMITQGTALLNGKPIQGPSPKVGVVFQNPLLFPWHSIQRNIELSDTFRGVARLERSKRAGEMLSRVGLNAWGNRYPHELSGGMKQRAAVARALMSNPEVLLMDEPFAALDYQTRLLMGEFVLDIWRQSSKTILFVTHSIDEAILLSDKVLVLSAAPGRIVEVVRVDLKRPRNTTSEAFNHYRVILTAHIQREVSRSAVTDAGRVLRNRILVPALGNSMKDGIRRSSESLESP